jgi:hypothetical protein
MELARDFYRDGIKDHATYSALAGRERDLNLREVLTRIAGIELKHSRFWRAFLETRGSAAPLSREGLGASPVAPRVSAIFQLHAARVGARARRVDGHWRLRIGTLATTSQ